MIPHNVTLTRGRAPQERGDHGGPVALAVPDPHPTVSGNLLAASTT